MPPQPFDPVLAKTLRCSRYAQRLIAADPSAETRLRERFGEPFDVAEMIAFLDSAAVDPMVDITAAEAQLKRSLRRLRQDVMLRIMARDLSQLASLDEVLTTVTCLAELAISRAYDFQRRALVRQYGEPRGPDGEALDLYIAGMGKLGGGELNVSSDIDLVFVYAEDGTTDGPDNRIGNQEFFARLGKKIIGMIDERTEDGFVFRVDMRLRPFGDSGPLVVSMDGLEHYFVTSARPWERYAWLKARVIGLPDEDDALDPLVRPFVYRKYHDYGMIQDLRELHAQIRAEATRKNKLDDIKVGTGGIRETEFVAQLHQLIRGGREQSLRTRSTRIALDRVAARSLISAESAAALQAAYAFLRNLEHRLQYLEDAQTQALPANEADQAIIADAMGYADWNGLLAVLDEHRAIVSREFDDLFAATPAEAEAEDMACRWSDSVDRPEELHARLLASGFIDEEAATLVTRLAQWRQSARYRFLTEKARAKLEQIIPLAIRAASGHAARLTTAFRLFDLLESVDRRDAYLSLLVENPAVLLRAARLAAKSAWAAGLLQRHPILLDELVQSRTATARADWKREREALWTEAEATHDDLERQYELLRHFKQIHTLRLNIADVDGALDVMTLADELSALADTLLDLALALAWRTLSRHRELETPRGVAVIGYGKLGSKELGYASDLDIVFVHDAEDAIGQEMAFKLAQRTNQLLNATTTGGVLYETDLRLRPDGAAGMMVTTLEALRDYQLKRAWVWEHQALTRARFCAGDARVAPKFEAIRSDVLCLERDLSKLKSDVLEMRAKMRSEHPGKPGRDGRVDLKHAQGGIVDLEFIVQFLVLGYANQDEILTRNTGNFALLRTAGELGLIDPAAAAAAGEAYLAFRARHHIARNNNESATLISPDELTAEREAVTKLWNEVFA
jgi:[glutamine synthetase] adenylyltransferase / [glutamine synthetase]-adenylyl-L-tyrosine phosphorylase